MDNEPANRFFRIPFSPTVGGEFTGFIHLTREGEDTLFASALREEGTSLPAAILIFERPIEEPATAGDKQTQELRDVDAFLRALPGVQITSPPKPGPAPNDPPDVVVGVDRLKWRIETTQMMMPEPNLDRANSALGRWHGFERLRNRILANHAPTDFVQHQGLILAMWFGEPGAVDTQRLPPRRIPEIDYVIGELKRMTPPQQSAASSAEPLPEAQEMAYSSDGSFGCTWMPPQTTAYASPFYSAMGFDLALSYYQTLTTGDVRQELRRLIEGHDTDKADILLVTVGAPTRSGLVFPAAGILARMAMDDPVPLHGWQPNAIARVVIHHPESGMVRWIVGSNPWPEASTLLS